VINKSFLDAVYRETLYITDLPQFFIRIDEFNESLNQFLIANNFTNWVFITASNPNSQLLNTFENEKRNYLLEKELRSKKMKYLRGRGMPESSDWDAEESFLVFNIEKNKAKQIAFEYDQNAIIYGEIHSKPELIWLIND
jgi:hypothetical protein